MGTELEIKYEGGADALSALERDEEVAALGAPWREIAMESIYYDTPEGEHSERRWVLRLRRENGASVVTFKTAGAGLCRGEWEYRADSVAEAASRLPALGAPEELGKLLSGDIAPLCGASFLRRLTLLTLPDGSQAELALDRGELFRGEKRAPLRELELELSGGNRGRC